MDKISMNPETMFPFRPDLSSDEGMRINTLIPAHLSSCKMEIIFIWGITFRDRMAEMRYGSSVGEMGKGLPDDFFEASQRDACGNDWENIVSMWPLYYAFAAHYEDGRKEWCLKTGVYSVE